MPDRAPDRADRTTTDPRTPPGGHAGAQTGTATAEPPTNGAGGAPATSAPAPAEPAYPRHWEADIVASDGRIVHLRPIHPSDADALLAFHQHLSDRTRYLRYFGPYPRIPPRDLERFVTVDHHKRVAFVALLGDEIIAVGRYEGLGDPAEPDAPVTSAEVAFVVRDDHQGRGLGSILLEHLAAAARENGLDRFEAEVLVENHTMVRVFREAGYQVRRAFAEGVLHLEFDIDPTERSLAVRDSREQAAEARSVANVLNPTSVAVIGASTDPSKIGHAVLANLLRANFTGPVYPVNPDARSVRGVRAYASVTDIPDPVDLAVVAIPASGIDEVMDSCLEKGVKALVVVSSGFADAGGRGVIAERKLVAEARAHGMRVIGPNALGVANLADEVRLNASLAPDLPPRGRVGFFSQSGALGTAILATAKSRGLGLSTFVSAGNRADVSGNDLLQFWQTDPATDVVLLYLETFGNPRKFGRLARRLARTKPVVAVKSGRHARPERLRERAVPIDDASVRALFEQSGVIRVETIAQLFDTALLLAYQPLPKGRRVAVVGNSTALNVLVTDALRDEGLETAGDPVDVGAAASPEEFAAAVGRALEADGAGEADSIVVVFVPPIATPGAEYARVLRETANSGADKPVAAVFLAMEGVPDELAVPLPDGTPGPGSVPSYASPERAVQALSRVARYAAWREMPVGEFVQPDGIDLDRARAVVESLGVGAEDDGATRTLTDDEAVELLGCFGIPLTVFRRVRGSEAAEKAADELGYPVALKAVGDRWRHRTDLVGVRLDLGSAAAVRRAFADLERVTGKDEVYVQRMAPKGTSCVLEVAEDPSFGSLLSFGISGMATQLLDDRAFRVVPLSTEDAAALIRAPRAAPLLTGYRGSEPADLAALEDLALRVGTMAEALPELRSLALDPVLASAEGAFVTGARVVLGPPPTRDDHGPRRLG
ncbi:bifunctional GNAT family N-acetyltransferase/acetate--CoA ligase family protein [Pseudonocardia kujensis]|uniref:bifunctional acetate--CoA ligase family protein/GNAT family N-acetyltransferase n=1 Tax=Pseudonocardia kujensis TaxID=1128675 RepID=UPI001E62C42A|nr:bifunctional GNAT family N-acetyltransferase/acetate--CoA ligase family protein [Pseudonocardia kujensis]MCE0767539.1 bifunctional GNAT family N-acetyltransferase/acetate--CoA ligase family protein [Pseudonocardia kujensis]